MTPSQHMTLLSKIQLGVNIFLIALLVIVYFTGTAVVNSFKKENALLVEKVYACEHAPTVTTTVAVPAISKDSAQYKPVPKPNPYAYTTPTHEKVPVVPADSSSPREVSKTSGVFYSEVYSGSKYKVHWEALTTIENDSAKIAWIKFPEILGEDHIITTTKTIHDTVKVDVPLKLKSKWGVYAGGSTVDFKSLGSFQGGAMYLHKQSWAIQAGPMVFDKQIMANFNFIFLF